MNTVTLIGLVRDAVSAVVGLLILFGVNFTDQQVAGILLVVTTVGALGSWLYVQWQTKRKGGDPSGRSEQVPPAQRGGGPPRPTS